MSGVKILPNNIVKQVLFIQFSIFASLFDPVLEKVDILARSHFDLKLIVKFLEVENLLHRFFEALDVAVVQPVERLRFFIEVDEVEIAHQT